MHYQKLTIEKEDDPKGRAFTVHLVASLIAPEVVPPPSGATVRPILLAYAGTPSAVRAFTTNLRAGLPAEAGDRRFELLRSLGYRVEVDAPGPGRSLAVAYLPHLFHLKPGAGEDHAIRFVSAPPGWWLDEQEPLLALDFGSAARDHARAMAWIARLDARCPLPIANDPGFHHALYDRALAQPWTATADHTDRLAATGLSALGLEEPVLCDVDREELADFLAEATRELLPRFVAGAPRPRAVAAGQLAFAFLAT